VLTLAESAKLSQNDLQRGVVETIVQTSAVLDRIPFLPITGNAFAYNEEATLPGVEFRAVNAAYSESTGTFNQKTEALVPLGGEADVDTFIVQTRGNLNDQRAIQEAMKAKAVSFKYQDAFINGDTAVDANSFDGLKKRLTGAQVIVHNSAGANGSPIIGTSSNDRQNFFDALDSLLAAVPGANGLNSAFYMNSTVRAKILSAARRETINTTTIDAFGKQLESYNGIQLVDVGTKADGTFIIPQTETTGASGVTSSIYLVKFGRDEQDRGVTGLTNGGVMAACRRASGSTSPRATRRLHAAAHSSSPFSVPSQVRAPEAACAAM
jgi:hypothetical protein